LTNEDRSDMNDQYGMRLTSGVGEPVGFGFRKQ